MAGCSDTFLAEVCIPHGHGCEALVGLHLGVRESVQAPGPCAQAPTWGAALRCLEYLFSKGLASR